jgi:hypothetical protein
VTASLIECTASIIIERGFLMSGTPCITSRGTLYQAAPSQRRITAALILLLLALLPVLASAQTEVRMKDGSLIQGRIVDNSEDEMVIRVSSTASGQTSDVTLEKAKMSYVRDAVHDKDVSMKYLGRTGENLPSMRSAPSAAPAPPRNDANAADPFAPPPSGNPVRVSTSPPSIGSDTRAEESLRGAEASGPDAYRSAIGIALDYVNFVNVPSTVEDKERFTPSLHFAYSSVPLQQDALHASAASKAVIPKSELEASLAVGPYYKDAPSRFDIDVSGSALVTPTFALGGRISTMRATQTDKSEWSSYSITYTQTEFMIAPTAVLYPSPTVRLTESFGFGTHSVAMEESGPGISFNDSRSFSSISFRHALMLALNPGFAYGHTLEYFSLKNAYDIIDFQNHFEFPTSERFSIGFQAGFSIRTYDNNDRTSKHLTVGPEWIIFPSPKSMLRLTPVYVFDFEDGTDSDISSKRNSYLDVEVRFDIRF